MGPKVRVNSVVAGPVETEQSHLHYGDDAGVAAVGATIPLGRMATPPVDVGNAVAFLLSPLAGYISGSTLTVHGGGARSRPSSTPRPPATPSDPPHKHSLRSSERKHLE